MQLELILYTKSGCCLCEGLEKKLKAIPLKDLYPKFKFSIKDIDGRKVSEIERANYLMKVPVLEFRLEARNLTVELPRVSPRLTKEALQSWLQNMIYEKIEKN